MIKSFSNKVSAAVFSGIQPRYLPPPIRKRAREKLDMVDNAKTLDDLLMPPANRLEKLTGHRKDQWSIRINQQWRVCFEWRDGHAYNVEIVDYH